MIGADSSMIPLINELTGQILALQRKVAELEASLAGRTVDLSHAEVTLEPQIGDDPLAGPAPRSRSVRIEVVTASGRRVVYRVPNRVILNNWTPQ